MMQIQDMQIPNLEDAPEVHRSQNPIGVRTTMPTTTTSTNLRNTMQRIYEARKDKQITAAGYISNQPKAKHAYFEYKY